MRIDLNSQWTFKELIQNIKAIKLQYEEVLLSFSNFKIKEQTQFRKEARDSIYALRFGEKKKNMAWEYINGFLEFEKLQKEIERNKRNGNKRKDKKINR